MVGHRLALLPGANRMVEVETAVPQGIPQFVRQLVELVVFQRVRLDHEHDVNVGARADLPARKGADRGKTHSMFGHVEGHGFDRFLPQFAQAGHRDLRTLLAFVLAVTVGAVGIRLADVHEALFQSINRRSHIPSKRAIFPAIWADHASDAAHPTRVTNALARRPPTVRLNLDTGV